MVRLKTYTQSVSMPQEEFREAIKAQQADRAIRFAERNRKQIEDMKRKRLIRYNENKPNK